MSRGTRDASPDGPKSGASAASSAGYEETQQLADGGPAPVDGRLKEGEDVAGRYRVVRFIAQGGMGEVYEVEDRELHERIAMKTVRANVAGASTEAQFIREIQMARSVTHPSVCRIFDVGHHVRSSGARIVFLTMELLPGETLRERIRRGGALDLETAARIVRQIAAALVAAHDASIVHRDLKSANVMLLPIDGGVRAVVTDFGLAHRVAAGEDVTASAGIAGTPAYMAPEQVEGTAITPRTDVYSLGVVMFEMVTGELPFTGGTALSVAAKRLTTAPPSPRTRRRELPAGWERAILACLERDPAGRPSSPREVVHMIDQAQPPRAFDSLHKRRPWVRPATALLVLVVATLVGLSVWHARHDSLAFLVKERGVQLDALTVDGEATGYDVAIRNALRLRLLGRVRLVATPMEIGLAPTVLRIGVAAPAGPSAPLRLDGRVHVAAPGQGREVEVTLRIVDPETHRERWSTVQRGIIDEIPALVARADDALEAELGTRRRAASTSRHDELVQKIEALALRGEVVDALEEAERGLMADPDSVELLIEAGEAWQVMTGDLYTRVLADRVRAYGPLRDPLWQARANALAAEHDPSQRTRALETAFALRPDNLVLALRLATTLVSSERSEDAKQLLGRLEREATTTERRIAVQYAHALVLMLAGDMRTALDLSRRTAEEARRAGLPAIELDALLSNCQALAEDGANPTCDRLATMAVEQRRPDALLIAADAAAYRQQMLRDPSWVESSERVMQIAEQAGDSVSSLLEQSMVARGLYRRGDTERARAMFLDVLARGRAVSDSSVVMQALMELGAVELRRGDLPEARRFYQELLEASQDAGSQGWATYALSDLARIDMEEGRPTQARRRLEDARPTREQSPITLYHYGSNAVLVLAELGLDHEADAQVEQLRHVRSGEDLGPNESSWQFWRCLVAYLRGQPAEIAREAARGLRDARSEVVVKELRRMELYGNVLAHGAPIADGELPTADGQTPWLFADVEPLLRFSLRRVRGDDPQHLLADIDRYVAATPDNDVRMRLRGRLERIAVLRELHDPRALDEAHAVGDEAHRAGLEAIARTAASLE